MDETGDQLGDQIGDQFQTQTITDGFKAMNIDSNSTERLVIKDLIKDMTDQCVSLLDNDDNNNTEIGFPAPFQELGISDTEEGLENDFHFDGQRNDEIHGTTNDNSNSDELVKVRVVSTEPKAQETDGLTLHGRHSKANRPFKPKTEKWGESVGIIDESGRVRRVVSLDELHNYMVVETRNYTTDSKIYCSLINERYPRFFDSTIDYLQRWRMRYNIFIDKVLADESDPSLVHIGELHMYFDLIPRLPIPYYVNNSFYSNPIEPEKPLNLDHFQKMKSTFDSIRRSPSIFQLKFPIRLYLFHKTDHIFDKFRERHHEIMEESRSIHRKGKINKERQKSGAPPPRGGLTRMDRDFGQSSREFHQTGRQFPRNDRKLSEMGQGFAATDREDLTEGQRGFGHNRRAFGRRFDRNFSASNRKPFNPKPKPMAEGRRRRTASENSNEMDVTFEDTRERHERNGMNTTFGRPHKSMNRNDREGEQRMDAFRDKRGNNYPKERINRTNSHPMDAEVQRRVDRDRDGFKNRDIPHFQTTNTPAVGPFYSGTDMDPNRRKNSVHSYGPNTGYIR